uniref:NADH-ubiquinone oxidoreductase chain 4L n=1 Tax=Erotylidae sp. BMNH 1274392 TaxID=1796504 RepID=A0A140EFV7_9CUCU|nr:NADH dehydrogenase subunit 4L [Erotylidae sp. BMNH 1274392]
MLVFYILSMMMYLSGLFSFSMKRKHLLLMLLSLEFIVLSLYFGLFIYFSMMSYDYFFSMIFLTISVCEGALGLSILVLMIRCFGNDYMMSFSLLW